MSTVMLERPTTHRGKAALRSSSPVPSTSTAKPRRNMREAARTRQGTGQSPREGGVPLQTSKSPAQSRTPQRQRPIARTVAQPAVEHRAEQASLQLSLPVLFILSGYLVGAALVIICTLDLLLAVPFSRASLTFDIGFLFSGALLLYLSWHARDGCR